MSAPGDVALVTARWAWNKPHSTKRAIRDAECWTVGGLDVMDHEVSHVHPLAVIDPEDEAALHEIVQTANFHMPGEFITPSVRKLQKALREFADPTPRIEEPTGLGAVVEDDRGVRWVRAESAKGMRNPWQATLHHAEPDRVRSLPYSDVKAVRVLSEGVQS